MWAGEGDLMRFEIQDNYEIKLDNVWCSTTDWSSCGFSGYTSNCKHKQDVFLSCSFGEKDEDSSGFTSFLFTLYFLPLRSLIYAI